MKIKALVCTGIGQLEIREFAKPEPEADAALLKVKYCGICGTDLHGIEGKRKVNFPFIPGHEIVATIDAIGSRAFQSIRIIGADQLSPGDRVTVNPRIVCSSCVYCQTFPDRQQLCLRAKTATSLGCLRYPHIFGGWAEYFYALPGSEIIRLPDDLPDEPAALVEPFACGIGLADRYRGMTGGYPGSACHRNDQIAVFGAGAIGILAIAALKLSGVHTLIAIDTNNERLSLAREFGADQTINAFSTTAEERREFIMQLTGGLGLDAVAECCGVPATIGEGMTLLRRRGILFEMGHLLSSAPAFVDPNIICRNEIQLLGHYAYPSSLTLLHAADVLKRQDFSYEKLLKFVDFEQFDAVIFQKKTEGAIKTVFSF